MLRVLAPAALLGVAGAVLVLVLVNPDSPCNDVDYAAFRAHTQQRNDIARRIDGCGTLDGMARDNIRSRLGNPDRTEADADHWTVRPPSSSSPRQVMRVYYAPSGHATSASYDDGRRDVYD